MPALLFGSISTIADSSEIQRESFNEAFAQHGLDWKWEGDEYRKLLEKSGGRDRVAEYAENKGEQVDADAIHKTKSEIFQAKLEQGMQPRDGVTEAIAEAKEKGYKLAFVTTTAPENVASLLKGTEGVSRDDFDAVIDLSQVGERKPAPEAYERALEELGVEASDAVAYEDNLGGIASAKAAGIETVAFPNANTAGHDFGEADRIVERVSLAA